MGRGQIVRALQYIVFNDGCWVWVGKKDRNGYGRIRADHSGPFELAHRVVYRHARGPFTGDLLHQCDNPSCVRPSHSRPGTQQDNTQEAWDRGQITGRYTLDALLEMERLTTRQAAVFFGTTRGAVTMRRWKYRTDK